MRKNLKKRQKNDTIKYGTLVKEVTKLKVAICDDEKPWAIEVNSLLNEYSRNRHIDIFNFFYESGAALIESEKNFDIIFMDYQMNELPLAETLGLNFCGKVLQLYYSTSIDEVVPMGI